ncbi:MAG TPA: hypothetical protein VFO25_08405 [Candidatus Eremiobacteraceae bacterium]|nr:hypothetical protein [Candidatus Eremiobacteraceae bacterium]
MLKRTLSLGIFIAAIIGTLSACGVASSVHVPTSAGQTMHRDCDVPQQPTCHP